MVTDAKMNEHITLEQLNWLAMRQSMSFKILMRVYKALHDKAPVYITERLKVYILSLKTSKKQFSSSSRNWNSRLAVDL